MSEACRRNARLRDRASCAGRNHRTGQGCPPPALHKARACSSHCKSSPLDTGNKGATSTTAHPHEHGQRGNTSPETESASFPLSASEVVRTACPWRIPNCVEIEGFLSAVKI